MPPANTNDQGPYLPPGTKVRFDGSDAGPEFGVVVHCWMNEEFGGYDCYVACFGSELPLGGPREKPYVLKYFARPLTVVSQ